MTSLDTFSSSSVYSIIFLYLHQFIWLSFPLKKEKKSPCRGTTLVQVSKLILRSILFPSHPPGKIPALVESNDLLPLYLNWTTGCCWRNSYPALKWKLSSTWKFYFASSTRFSTIWHAYTFLLPILLCWLFPLFLTSPLPQIIILWFLRTYNQF